MQAFLEQVVKGLVDYPDAVNITEVEQERAEPQQVARDAQILPSTRPPVPDPSSGERQQSSFQ